METLQFCIKPSICYQFIFAIDFAQYINTTDDMSHVKYFDLWLWLSQTGLQLFVSDIKTVCGKSYIFDTKKIYVSENVLDNRPLTLTQGHSYGIH